MYVSIRDDIVLQAFPTIADGLEALGIDAVELEVHRDMRVKNVKSEGGVTYLTLNSPAEIERYAEHLAEHSVRASAFLLHNDFNRDDWEDEVKWVTDVVNAAAALAIPAVRIDAVMTGETDLPMDRRVTRFADCMKRVLDHTDYHIVELGIENHGRQGNDPDFLENVLDGVGSPRLGLTLDTGNFYWFGHPLNRVYEIIERFADRVKHTHVKNISFPEDTRENQREIGWRYMDFACPIPDGDIDHFKVYRILKKAGYEGDLCIEDESLGKFSEDKRGDQLHRDAEHLRGVIGE